MAFFFFFPNIISSFLSGSLAYFSNKLCKDPVSYTHLVVTAVETVGDISGVMEGGLGREATDRELAGGVMCDGLGSSFAALFGVLPNTSFSQNVGLVAMTKVVNRFALATGAIFLILCGLCPKLAALVSIMPQSVLGGAAVMMFSSIVISGIQLITKNPLTARNLSIVSVALGVGSVSYTHLKSGRGI